MEKSIKLLGKIFDIWTKKRWLKSIEREIDKYRKKEHKARAQAKVVHALCDRYAELYGEDLRKGT